MPQNGKELTKFTHHVSSRFYGHAASKHSLSFSLNEFTYKLVYYYIIFNSVFDPCPMPACS
jgi:hypothetical protein